MIRKRNPARGIAKEAVVIHTHVHLRLPDGDTLLCGEMVTLPADPGGPMRGAFRYSSSCLNHPAVFAMDPHQLTLSTDALATDRPSGVHAVFEDALPDAQMPELARLLEAAYRYDVGDPVSEEAMTLLFRAASSSIILQCRVRKTFRGR